MMRAILTLMFFLGALSRCAAQWDPPQPIMWVLIDEKISASMELSECLPGAVPSFPHARVRSTSKGSAVEEMREVLADNPNLNVTQDVNGMIRVVEGGVSADILNVKISHIIFEDEFHTPVHTASSALRAILRAPEVSSFMHKHHMDFPSDGGGVGGSDEGHANEMPHLPGSLDNVTLFQALDEVVRAYPGLWVYWSCPQPNNTTVVSFRVFRANKVGDQLYVY